MKIFFVVVCFALTRVLKANDLTEIESNGVNDVIVSKVIQGLNHIKSAKCKSDLNYTTNAFTQRASWAVASKNEFCVFFALSASFRFRSMISCDRTRKNSLANYSSTFYLKLTCCIR